MLTFKVIQNDVQLTSPLSREQIVNFLHKHLGVYTDTKEAINKAIDYSFSDDPGRGGFLLLAIFEGELAGALVMISTGMAGFVPENLLVYVAVDSKFRNRGFGKLIVTEAIKICGGDVALHCDLGNPAQHLYERMGFEVKYNEMRFYKTNGQPE